jgi:hypothetical protein
MANSTKSIVVVQEVQVLPRVTASHRPSSETRWQEETNVRSRVKQIGRPCIELRNGVYVVVQNARHSASKGINAQRTPESAKREPRTVSTHWNATSEAAHMASHLGGHRSRRPEHAGPGMTRELVRASSSPVVQKARNISGATATGVHRVTKAPLGKAPPQGRSRSKNAGNAGTTQRAGWRRRVGRTLGSLS